MHAAPALGDVAASHATGVVAMAGLTIILGMVHWVTGVPLQLSRHRLHLALASVNGHCGPQIDDHGAIPPLLEAAMTLAATAWWLVSIPNLLPMP